MLTTGPRADAGDNDAATIVCNLATLEQNGDPPIPVGTITISQQDGSDTGTFTLSGDFIKYPPSDMKIGVSVTADHHDLEVSNPSETAFVALRSGSSTTVSYVNISPRGFPQPIAFELN